MKPGALPDLVVGLVVTALGLLTAWLTWIIPLTPVYAVVGPKLVPAVIAAALVVLGLLLTGSGLRGGCAS